MGDLDGGLLCACLPTEQNEGLPFHLNADFFTSNDRKRVILSSDYQSEWNRAAILAAGLALGSAVKGLPSLLGARRFWQLVSDLKATADRAGSGENLSDLHVILGEGWAPVRAISAIQTTKGEWVTAPQSCLLSHRDEAAAIPVLEGLGINVAHEELRPFQTLLRSEAVGVHVLDVETITTALVNQGLDRRMKIRDLPIGLRASSGREALWGEIATLLERQQRTLRAKAEDERRLQHVALAPGRDGALWPCKDIFFADPTTVALFEPLKLDISFVADDRTFEPLRYLCTRFDAAAAIGALERLSPEEHNARWHKGELPLRRASIPMV